MHFCQTLENWNLFPYEISQANDNILMNMLSYTFSSSISIITNISIESLEKKSVQSRHDLHWEADMQMTSHYIDRKVKLFLFFRPTTKKISKFVVKSLKLCATRLFFLIFQFLIKNQTIFQVLVTFRESLCLQPTVYNFFSFTLI